MSDVFRLLFVCTGNICRSPMAERYVTARLDELLSPEDRGRFEVSSAGTYGLTGEPMDPSAVRALTDIGGVCDGFAARELTPELVAEADLVLGATRQHRAGAVTLHPRAAAKTFTIRELGRLSRGVDGDALPSDDVVERARAFVRAAAAQRGLHPPATPADDDVPDPYRRSPEAFREVARLLTGSLELPLALLAPRIGAPG